MPFGDCALRGLIHVVVAPMKTFGVVMSVTFPGLMMDIGHLRHLRVAKDNDTQSWINYNRLRGQQQSFLEAAVPDQAFTLPSAAMKPESVSAATAIALATRQGQKIFTFTQANAAVALPQVQQSTSVMAEINNALNAGKEVTVSEKPVTVAGWTGAGYIIIDPATGAGAYLIEGGANGNMTTTPSPGESIALWMMTQTAAIFTKLASLANSSGVLSILGYIDAAFALTQCSDPVAAELGLYILTSLTIFGLLLGAMVMVSGGFVAAIGVGIAYSLFTFGVMYDVRKACKK